MVRASQKRARRRALDRHGQSVDLKTFSKTGEDDHGPEYDDSTTAVTARVDRSARANPNRDAFGADVEADAEVFVKDTVTGIRDGGGDGASEIDIDQDGDFELAVLVADDQDNGLIRLFCTRLA